jgi:glycine cleavage system H protein
MYPADYKYSNDHEWISITGDRGRIGITDYAQQQLGDVVYVQLPPVGQTLAKGQIFGSVESVKAVSDLFSPMSGEVVDVNAALVDRPELVNEDPHGAWMIVVRLSDPAEAQTLLDSTAYAAIAK